MADTVSYIGSSAFYSCGLTNSNFSFPKKLKLIDNYAFAYNKFNRLDLGSLTNLEIIKTSAFYNCSTLRDVIFPESIKEFTSPFSNCNNFQYNEVDN